MRFPHDLVPLWLLTTLYRYMYRSYPLLIVGVDLHTMVRVSESASHSFRREWFANKN